MNLPPSIPSFSFSFHPPYMMVMTVTMIIISLLVMGVFEFGFLFFVFLFFLGRENKEVQHHSFHRKLFLQKYIPA